MRYILDRVKLLLENSNNITIGEVDMGIALETWKSLGYPVEGFHQISTWVDMNISKSIYVNGSPVGVYLLGTKSIFEIMNFFESFPLIQTPLEDLEKYRNKRGLQGIHLCVLPEFKDKGLGKKLIEYSESLDFDYIWGMHSNFLKNKEHWEKRRRIVVEISDKFSDSINDGFYTLKDLK